MFLLRSEAALGHHAGVTPGPTFARTAGWKRGYAVDQVEEFFAQARVSYTLSKAIDDAGNAFFFTPQDNSDLRDERGLADAQHPLPVLLLLFQHDHTGTGFGCGACRARRAVASACSGCSGS